MFLSDPRESDITFAEPGGSAPFTFALRDATTGNALSIDATGDVVDADIIAKRAADLRTSIVAAERQTRLVDTINARQSALAEAADHRIRIVREQTGIQLENPFDGGYDREARQRVSDARARGEAFDPTEGDQVRFGNARVAIFNEQVNQAAERFPEKAAALSFGQSLDDQAKAISQSAAYDGTHAPAAGVDGFAASIIGGLWGSRRDPLFLGTLFAGPGVETAGATIAKIGWGAIKQGLFNAGAQAVAQPTVQGWRAEIGERSGLAPALENVGMAFLFGAIPGAGIEGVRALSAGQKASIARIAGGAATPEDVHTAAGALGVKLDAATEAELRTAAGDAANQARAVGEPPAAIRAQQHDEIAAQAVRYADDPENNPPPEIPITAPARAADRVRVLDERLPATLGETQTVDGKPVTFEQFRPGDLATDAAAFQYKGGGDAAGVTDRLKSVTQWDPIASGKTLVFERTNGERVIADGHQRLGLAKRLTEKDGSIRLDGYLFREADGWTPEDVRAIAAKKNMQEGSGDAIDAARVLRDRPDLLDGSLPISSPMMKNAIALARLSDEAFGMAINGVVPPNYAAAVGSMVHDKLQHAAVIADLVRFAPETEREARMLIGEIKSAGFRAEEQINLFGAAVASRTLMGERVRVLDAAMTALTRDKRLFGTLAEKADAIEAAGNQLARGTNDARARDASTLQDMLARLARRTGPVSDALNRAAAQVAQGTAKTGKAAEAFLDDVRTLLDRDGLNGLLASPELKPAAVVEPGRPEALAAAEAAFSARTESASPRPPQSQETAIAAAPDFLSGQRGLSLEDLYGRAVALQTQLTAAAERLAGAIGARFVDPGPKKFATAAEKIARKGYRDASQMTDIARGGFIVTTPEQAARVVAGLSREFEVLDEGWKVNAVGYTDRKVLVRDAAGTVGEIQIIPAPMYEAKKGGGQALYTQSRSMSPGIERDAIDAQQGKLYSAASARLDPAWSGIFETSSEPNLGSNARRQAASAITPEVSATSSSSTFDQPSPGASTANAHLPGDNTAGRKSQLQNVSAIENNLGASAAAGKPEDLQAGLFDSLAVSTRDDGRDVRFISRADALAEADKPAEYADLVASCKAA
ncbi:hypothetical protein AC629_42135 [Bradyrhizobium sp. NAS80.1]|uniref:hypothetical protein n=1 Tax=Bradyrhizobium sp. NAS80.1 TaxID=1680159 RepID=UPI000968F446|nr:hypothetical protein [Bradyrhizobium sp. NAS80.1]OKO68418.1 hypothetical protein AC629_42135 [Bradyrhizobium sp. NAS80.1]